MSLWPPVPTPVLYIKYQCKSIPDLSPNSSLNSTSTTGGIFTDQSCKYRNKNDCFLSSLAIHKYIKTTEFKSNTAWMGAYEIFGGFLPNYKLLTPFQYSQNYIISY